MNTDTRDPLRLIQSGLDKLGHSPGAPAAPGSPTAQPAHG